MGQRIASSRVESARVERSTAPPCGPTTSAANRGEFVYSRYAHPTGAAAERALGRSRAATHCSMRRGPAVTAIVLRVRPVRDDGRDRRGRLLRHGRALAVARALGVDVVEFDQTGAPPAGARSSGSRRRRTLSSRCPTGRRLRAHPGIRGLRRDGLDAGLPARARRGRRRRRPLGDEVPDGPHDAMLGATVSGASAPSASRVRARRGLAASPDAAAALLRGLETLALRMRRQTETATVIAARLSAPPSRARVRYPGFGGLISSTSPSRKRSRRRRR